MNRWKLGMLMAVAAVATAVFVARPRAVHAEGTCAGELDACESKKIELQRKVKKGAENLRECAAELRACQGGECPTLPTEGSSGGGMTHREVMKALLSRGKELSVEDAAKLTQFSTRVLRDRALAAPEGKLPAIRDKLEGVQESVAAATQVLEKREKQKAGD